MSASLKVGTMFFKRLAQRFMNPSIREQMLNVPREKAFAAQIGQAISDNFSKNGPGWAPLKFRKGQPLQKTRLLKASVTMPASQYNINQVNGTTMTWGTKLAYAGIHNKGGTISAKNAKALFIPISNKAMKMGPTKNKADRLKKNGTSKLEYGKDFLLAKSVKIPKREFLVIRPEWKRRIAKYLAKRYKDIVRQSMAR